MEKEEMQLESVEFVFTYHKPSGEEVVIKGIDNATGRSLLILQKGLRSAFTMKIQTALRYYLRRLLSKLS